MKKSDVHRFRMEMTGMKIGCIGSGNNPEKIRSTKSRSCYFSFFAPREPTIISLFIGNPRWPIRSEDSGGSHERRTHKSTHGLMDLRSQVINNHLRIESPLP